MLSITRYLRADKKRTAHLKDYSYAITHVKNIDILNEFYQIRLFEFYKNGCKSFRFHWTAGSSGDVR